jgi:hypothetical protein
MGQKYGELGVTKKQSQTNWEIMNKTEHMGTAVKGLEGLKQLFEKLFGTDKVELCQELK